MLCFAGMKTKKAFVILLDNTASLQTETQTQAFLSFFRCLHSRYSLAVYLFVVSSSNCNEYVKTQFATSTQNNIHHLSVVQIELPGAFIMYVDQIMHRLQRYRTFEYLFLINSDHAFNKTFYNHFALYKHKIGFLNDVNARTPKTNNVVNVDFVTIPQSIAMRLNHLPLTTNALDYINLPHALLHTTKPDTNNIPLLEIEVYRKHYTQSPDNMWVHIHIDDIEKWGEMKTKVDIYQKQANVIVTFSDGVALNNDYDACSCLFVKIYTTHSVLIRYYALSVIAHYGGVKCVYFTGNLYEETDTVTQSYFNKAIQYQANKSKVKPDIVFIDECAHENHGYVGSHKFVVSSKIVQVMTNELEKVVHHISTNSDVLNNMWKTIIMEYFPIDIHTHDDDTFMQEDTYCIMINKTMRFVQNSRCKRITTNQLRVDKVDIATWIKYIKCPRASLHATNRPKINYAWYRKAYSIPQDIPCSHYYYQHGLTKGHITHISQIHKLYPEAKYTTVPNLRIELNGVVYDSIHQFVEQKMSLHQICERCALKEKDIQQATTSNRNTVIVITSTNDNICLHLLMCCDELLRKNRCDVCLCYLTSSDHPRSLAYLKLLKTCNVYIFHYMKDVGSDILPFYIVYNRLFHTDKRNYPYVLKLHTKSNTCWRLRATRDLIQFICQENWEKELDNHCGASSHVSKFDNYNRYIIEKEFFMLTDKHTFSAGTFFLMKKNELENIFRNKKIRDLLKCSAICGCYYDNITVIENSPIHSMERLFGYLPAENKKPLKHVQMKHSNNIHILVLIATHANTPLKKKTIENNHHFLQSSIYAKYKADIIYIHSEECGQIHNTTPLLQRNNCGTCEHHYIKNNLALLDSHKWLFAINKGFGKEKYSHVALLNDSFILLRPVPELFDFFVKEKNMCGLLKSTEIQLHIQSFCRCMPSNLISQYVEYIENCRNKVKDYKTNVNELEVKICECLKPTWLFDSPDNVNIHFHDHHMKHYVCDLNYPCMKLKWAMRSGKLYPLACDFLKQYNIFVQFKSFC